MVSRRTRALALIWALTILSVAGLTFYATRTSDAYATFAVVMALVVGLTGGGALARIRSDRDAASVKVAWWWGPRRTRKAHWDHVDEVLRQLDERAESHRTPPGPAS